MTETIIKFCFCIFGSADSLPRPLLRAKTQNEFPPNFKKNQPRFLRNPFPENCFRKISSVFAFPHSASFEKYRGEVWSVSRTSAFAEAPRFAWWRFSARGTLV
jgi:hypothetical protein